MSGYLPEKQRTGSQDGPPRQKSHEGRIAAWFTLLKSSWQTILSVDRASITAFQAMRSTFGVALPLVLGVVTGQVTTGVLIASGALMLGSVGLKEPYRSRAHMMLLASLFVTLSTLVGSLIGGLGWLPVLVIGLWGICAGMFASLSNVAQIVGVQSCVALIVYTHLGLDPLHALLTASLVCAGTLFQILLAMLPSPWKNTFPERTTLAAIYQSLADYAANPSQEPGAVQISDILLTGHTVLLNSDTRSEKGQMFARLLEEAEHLRMTLSLLASQRQHLSKLQGTEHICAILERITSASSEELRAIAQALKPSIFAGTTDTPDSSSYKIMKQALAELRYAVAVHEARDPREIQPILSQCTALLGEIRIARRLAISWRYAHQYWPVRIRFPYPRPPRLHLEDAWANLRANLTPHSSALRHAARLGVTLALCTALYQIFHIPVERGYWIPMTAALVLRSDFITTFTRGFARLIGTVLGAVLTTLLVILLAPTSSLLMAVVILATYLMFATLFANYTIFSVAITMAVVFLLSFVRAPTLSTAADRALDTTIGGVLALLIYALWPTWEQSQVFANIAIRLEKLARYFGAVMHAYADPAVSPINVFDRRHIESRLARSNALASVQRVLQEPTRYDKAELATTLLAAIDNLSRCVLTLEAYLHDNPLHYTLPAVATFSSAIDGALNQLAAALRTEQPAGELPDLPQALQKLKGAVKASMQTQVEPGAREQWHLVLEQAKRMVKYIEAIQQLLSANSSE